MKNLFKSKLRESIETRGQAVKAGLSRNRARRAIWGAMIGIAAAGIFASLIGAGFLDTLENRTYDWRMSLTRHAAKGSGSNVALFYVDEPSLSTMKGMGISWPWPRELYADALEFAKRGGAKAVLFDLFFSEDSSYGVADDEAFGRGIAEAPPTYFVFFASKNEGPAPSPDSEVLARTRVPFGGSPPDFLPEVRSIASLPVPAIAQHAAGFGNAQTSPDADGIFRRLPPALRMGDHILPQVTFEVAGSVGSFNSIDWKSSADLLINGKRVPLDDEGNLLINYIGGVESYPVYPLAQVLISDQQIKEGKKPDLDPSVVKDRVVIIGVAAPGLYDLKPMPLSRVYPGPEVHATVIDNLLKRDFISPLHAGGRLAVLFIMSLAVAVGLSQISRLSHIILWIAGLAALYTACSIALFANSILVPLAAPLGAIALSSFAMIVRNYLTEGRKKQAIKRAFGQYLSPAVVGEIARDPDNIRMGGEEQEVSVFFSDIANFTSISEGMPPTELVSQLCAYLTHMTGIITDREGTLDKYIGDAVMAFWGAPLKIQDHAAQAVLAALEIQKALKEFPQFATRIGIHTGNCVVGNIGSDLRFNYTAIGDTVNLASRLEGLNKQFGTRIIVSESTYRQAESAIAARMIGKVRVKGRAEPIDVYQPLCAREELSHESAQGIGEFMKAISLFMAGDFAGAKSVFNMLREENDPVVAYYFSMCDKFEHNPPAKPFDGVITFTEK